MTSRLRVRMEAPLVPSEVHAVLPLRPVAVAELASIAEVMYISYHGTIDDEGQTPEGVLAAVADFAAGKYGPALLDCSYAAWDGGRPVAGVLVSEENGIPLLAYVFTHPDWQNRGLSTACIQASISALAERGYARAKLRVTVGNKPAVRVYEKLGFREVPE